MTLYKHRKVLLLFAFLLPKLSFAQLTNCNVFLKGNYVEIGINVNGAYGSSTNAPAGYHPKGPATEYNPCTGGCATTNLGFVADPDKNGWTTGTPKYFGDYFLPGYPQEGWSIMSRGNQANSWNGGGQCGSVSQYPFSVAGLTGTNTTCTSTGNLRMGVWQGTYDSLAITQTTVLDTSKVFFTVYVTVTNNAHTARNNLYYLRTVDPDNDEPEVGFLGFTTINSIDYSLPNNLGATLVSATSLTYSRCYLGLGTLDCRAKCFIDKSFVGLEPSAGTLDSMYEMHNGLGDTANYIYSGKDTADVGISIVYKLGSLNAGDSLNLAYAYILNQADITQAFLSTAPKWSYNGVTHNSGDTLTVCRNAGTLPLSIVQSGPYTTWAWTSLTNDVISPATGTNVNVTLDTESMAYIRAIGTSACGTDTLIIRIKTPQAIKVDSAGPICGNGSVTLHAHNRTGYSWTPATGLSCTNCANPVASPTATTTYKVVGTDTLGCSDSAYVTVTVSPSPAVNTGADTAFCAGGSVNLTATGAVTYSWAPATGLSCTSCANPTASPTATTTYVVTGTSAGGCTANDTMVVTVRPLPVVNAGPDTAVCTGGSVNLLASGAVSYTWAPATGLSCTNCANPTCSPTATTTYIVTGTSVYGCIGHDTITVSVHTYLSVNAGPDTAVCLGGSVNLNATGATTYSWAPATGLSCTNCANPTASPTVTTTYIVTGTSAYGCVGHDTIVVNVHPLPLVNAGPDTAICLGGSVNLSASGANTYAWSPATGLSCTNCANPTASPTVATTYIVTGTSAYGCVGHDTIVVNVHPLPLVNAGPDTAACFGGSVNLSASGAVTYSWSPSAGLSCTNCANPTASPTITTTYIVTGTSAYGCIGYDTIVVNVHPLPIVNAGQDTAICLGSSVNLSATGADTYAWSPTTGLSCTNCANPVASPTVTTTYIVTGTSAYGCIGHDTIIVNAHPLPVVTAGTDTAICLGGSVNLLASGANTYVWSPATGLSCTNCASPTASPTTTTTYIVTGISAYGCIGHDTIVVSVHPLPVVNAGPDTAVCLGGSVSLNATGATTYSWTPATGLSCTNCANPTASPTVTTTYIVTGTSVYGCIGHDTIIVNVHPFPVVNAGPDTAICFGGSVNLSASGAATYAWSPATGLSCTNCSNPVASPTITTTYIVTGTSAYGCIGHDTIVVNVHPLPVVNAGPDTAICFGGSVNLLASGAAAYTWSPSAELSCTNCSNPVASPTVTTTYIVTGTSVYGCIGHDTVVVNAHPLPAVNAGPDTAVCFGTSVNLLASGAITYTWAPSAGLSCTNCANPIASPTTTSTYIVTGTSAYGCIGHDTIAVGVHPLPVVNAGPDTAICLGSSVNLLASGAATYNWSPSVGLSCMNCANPNASPTATTTYIVTGTSVYGCIGHDTIIVNVHPLPVVNAGPDTAVCLGGSINLSASGAATYNWSPATGLSCTGCANPTASPTVTTTYIVTGTSAYGCIGHDTVVVNVHPLPVVNAGPDTSICLGGSVNLSASGANTYTWSPATGLSCTGCANPTASPTVTTTYIVTGTSVYGCIGHDTVVVNAHPLPVVNAGPDTSICLGGSVNLSASGANTYTWSPATGLSCTNCANPTASPTITTTYVVTGTSAYGCIGHDTVVVNVHPLPAVNAGPDTAICLGGSVNLSVNGAATYTWSPATGLSCTNCSNPSASPTVTTSYIVTGTSAYGCIGHDTIVVNVHPLPTVNAGPDTAVCLGGSVNLLSSGAATYSWSPSTGLSCTNCANPTASPTVTTTYIVTGTSAYGCIGDDTITVSVHPYLNVHAGPDTAICPGGSVLLNANGADVYAWSPAIGLSCSNCASPIASPAITTTYIVTGTSTFGCTGYDTITVTVHPTPSVNAGPDTAVCLSNSVNLAATGAATYIWSPANGLSCTNCANPTASPTVATTYVVTGISAYGCVGYDSVTVNIHSLPIVNAGPDTAICSGGSVALGASGAASYSWSPASGLSCTNCANPVASPTITTTYIVTGTSAYGCIGYDTVIVTVHPLPVVNAGLDTAICIGGTVNLSASGAASYVWSPATGLSCTNCAYPVASPTVTTNYIVTGTSTYGCVANDTVKVTVHPLPIVNAGADTAVCLGGSVSLLASGASSYSWSPAAGLSCTNCANPIASPTTTTTYIVTGTSAYGCINQDTITVSVHALPVINAGNDTAICKGNSVILNASGASSYTWSPAAGLSCTNCANPTASPTTTKTYVVTGTSAYGCIGHDTVTVTIHPLPVVNAGSDTAVCTGGSVNLSANGATSYSWSPATGLSCTNCANPTASPTVTTNYIVTGTSAYGCIGNDTVKVTVHPLPLVNAGPDTAVCPGGSVNLSASGAATYSWSPAVGLSCSSCANPIASPTTTTTYIVNGTSVYGCVNQDTVTVSVHALPVVHAGNDTAICKGYSATLTGTGANTYTWSPITGLSCTNCASPVASPTITTTYIVTGTSAQGCVGHDTITVTVNTISIHAGNDTALCFGDSVTLNAAGGIVYSWSPAVGLSCSNCANPVATPSVTTTYILTGTNEPGCTANDTLVVTIHPLPIVNAGADTGLCQGTSVHLLATGATTYNWLPATGLSCSNCANPTAAPTTTTTYVVTGTSTYGCVSHDTINVAVHPIPVVNAGADTAICMGNSVVLQGGGNYTWSPATGLSCSICANPVASPTMSTTYIASSNSAYGCVGRDTVVVTVRPLPVVTANNDTTICAGGTVTLTATGANNYVWTPAAGLSCADCASPTTSPTDDVSYKVTGSDIYGCTASDSLVIKTIKKHATAGGGNDTICTGQNVQLNASGGDSYLWVPGDGLSNNTSANPTASPDGNTDYNVYVYQGGCFVDTYAVHILVYPTPTVTLGPDQSVVTGSTITLNAVATNTLKYEWYPIATECNNCSSVNIVANQSGRYTVVVTGEKGCQDSASVMIKVHCDKSEIFIPNTFTPNNDGNNDLFYASGKGISLIKVFNVYDRWGELLYSVHNVPPNEVKYGWDGTYKGEKLKPDVYVYYIIATCESGEAMEYKGDISLIR